MADSYTQLARKAIEEYLDSGKIITPEKSLPAKMLEERAGVFVSLHKKDGRLRGCIGTYIATRQNIAEEIIHNAISAAVRDPRFYPLRRKMELDYLNISVDILSPLELVQDEKELNPKKYGLVVKDSVGRTGLLLPDIPNIKTVNDQILIACEKAGIDQALEKIEMQKFTVERHEEK